MIKKSNLQRARKIIKKCQEGGNPSLIDDTLKQKYATTYGYVFKDGQFFVTDAEGKEQMINITDDTLLDFANGLNTNKEKWRKAGDVITAADNMLVGSSSNIQNQSALTQGILGLQGMAGNVLEEAGLDKAAGFAKAGKFATDLQIAAGLTANSGSTVDNIMNGLPVLGAINAIGGSTTDDFSINQEAVERGGSSYGGLVSTLQSAKDKANRKHGLFDFGGTSRDNKYINKAKTWQDTLAQITNRAFEQSQMVNAMGDIASSAYAFNNTGGYKQNLNKVKEGGKLVADPNDFEPEFVDIKRITPGEYHDGGIILKEKINPTTGRIEPWEPEFVTLPETKSMKKGGRIEKQLDAPEIEETTQKNLVPEGALHKDKHHMENTEDLTKKGIPVIDDKRNQSAEIEREEIIFTKEVTDKLEELYKIFYSDDSTKAEKEEAALEAGKLLTKEIMLNTDDRAGIIDKLQDGGTIGKLSYKEWLKTVNPAVINDNYDLENAYNYLPFETLEKWRNATLDTNNIPEGEDWHLPSVAQIDENTYIYLKKGRTTKDNPELQGEFDYYANDPNFKQEFKMKFNKDNNRWYYVRRQKEKAKE